MRRVSREPGPWEVGPLKLPPLLPTGSGSLLPPALSLLPCGLMGLPPFLLSLTLSYSSLPRLLVPGRPVPGDGETLRGSP